MAKFNHTNSYFYKFASEKFDIEFDFTNSLGTGESLSTCIVTASDSSGTDATSSMISSTSVSSPYCYFTIEAGTSGETYELKLAGTSDVGKVYTSYITCEVFESVTLNANIGDPNANSYVTLEEANNYIRNVRGHSSVWDMLSVEGKKRVLIEAARSIDKLSFSGSKYYDFQGMQFPRDDHEVLSDTVATPITLNSFKNTNFTSDTYGSTRSHADYWKYGTIHITEATPLYDIRMISSSSISTDVITVNTDFSATPTTNTEFIAFEPIHKNIKHAQCEQALFILDNTNRDELSAYGVMSKEVEIGDVRVVFKDNFNEASQGYPSSVKKLLSLWSGTKVLRVYRS